MSSIKLGGFTLRVQPVIQLALYVYSFPASSPKLIVSPGRVGLQVDIYQFLKLQFYILMLCDSSNWMHQ